MPPAQKFSVTTAKTCARAVVLALILAACLCVAPALAADQTDGQTDGQVAEGTGPDASRAARSANATAMREMVVTATRTEREMQYVPSAVSVVTREDIERSPYQDAISVLKDTAGVMVYNGRGPLSTSTYNKVIIRGMGADSGRVLVLIDGVPYADAQSQQFEWSLLNKDDIERIEVLRGPASALYGSHAMGGVVNVITRKPVKEGSTTTLETGFGTFDTWSEGLRHSARKGKLGYTLSGKMTGTQGYATRPEDERSENNGEDVRARREMARGAVTYDFDETSRLTVDTSYGNFRNQGMYKFDPDFLLFTNTDYRGRATYEKDFGTVKTTFTGHAGYTDGKYENPDSTTNPTRVEYTKTGDQWQMGGEGQASFALGDSHFITTGLSFTRNGMDTKYSYRSGARERTRGGLQDVYSVFLQDEMTFFNDRLVIVPGLRYDYWRTHEGFDKDTDLSPTKNEYDAASHSSVSPRVGVRYNVSEGLALRAAVGQAFRVANLNKLYGEFISGSTVYQANPNLDPEKSTTYEIGMDVSNDQGMSVGLTAYKTSAHDYIATVDNGVDAGGNTLKTYRNEDRVDIHGAEIEAAWQFSERWRFFGGYTMTDAEILSGTYKGKRPTGIPNSKVSYGFDYANPALFNLRIVGRTMGSIEYNSANTQTYGDYTDFDAQVSRAFAIGETQLEASLDVTNILNEEIRETKSSEAPGRSFFVTLRYTF
jgi:outer membrane receptor protein involved in Fe transport